MARYSQNTPEAPFYKWLGRNLRVARSAAGKRQEDAAEHIEVSFQQIQKYENGLNRIPLYDLLSLADYFEVPLLQFLAPSDSDSEFQSLAEKFSAKELPAFMEAWGSIKDRAVRAALVELVKCMAKIKR